MQVAKLYRQLVNTKTNCRSYLDTKSGTGNLLHGERRISPNQNHHIDLERLRALGSCQVTMTNGQVDACIADWPLLSQRANEFEPKVDSFVHISESATHGTRLRVKDDQLVAVGKLRD